MSDTSEDAAREEQLRAAAAEAQQGAVDARRLALDIERRRVLVVHRHGDALARHTPSVWSSQAATVSRTELRDDVGFSLWAAGESLLETCRALEQHAGHLDGTAAAYRRQADLLG